MPQTFSSDGGTPEPKKQKKQRRTNDVMSWVAPVQPDIKKRPGYDPPPGRDYNTWDYNRRQLSETFYDRYDFDPNEPQPTTIDERNKRVNDELHADLISHNAQRLPKEFWNEYPAWASEVALKYDPKLVEPLGAAVAKGIQYMQIVDKVPEGSSLDLSVMNMLLNNVQDPFARIASQRTLKQVQSWPEEDQKLFFWIFQHPDDYMNGVSYDEDKAIADALHFEEKVGAGGPEAYPEYFNSDGSMKWTTDVAVDGSVEYVGTHSSASVTQAYYDGLIASQKKTAEMPYTPDQVAHMFQKIQETFGVKIKNQNPESGGMVTGFDFEGTPGPGLNEFNLAMETMFGFGDGRFFNVTTPGPLNEEIAKNTATMVGWGLSAILLRYSVPFELLEKGVGWALAGAYRGAKAGAGEDLSKQEADLNYADAMGIAHNVNPFTWFEKLSRPIAKLTSSTYTQGWSPEAKQSQEELHNALIQLLLLEGIGIASKLKHEMQSGPVDLAEVSLGIEKGLTGNRGYAFEEAQRYETKYGEPPPADQYIKSGATAGTFTGRVGGRTGEIIRNPLFHPFRTAGYGLKRALFEGFKAMGVGKPEKSPAVQNFFNVIDSIRKDDNIPQNHKLAAILIYYGDQIPKIFHGLVWDLLNQDRSQWIETFKDWTLRGKEHGVRITELQKAIIENRAHRANLAETYRRKPPEMPLQGEPGHVFELKDGKEVPVDVPPTKPVVEPVTPPRENTAVTYEQMPRVVTDVRRTPEKLNITIPVVGPSVEANAKWGLMWKDAKGNSGRRVVTDLKYLENDVRVLAESQHTNFKLTDGENVWDIKVDRVRLPEEVQASDRARVEARNQEIVDISRMQMEDGGNYVYKWLTYEEFARTRARTQFKANERRGHNQAVVTAYDTPLDAWNSQPSPDAVLVRFNRDEVLFDKTVRYDVYKELAFPDHLEGWQGEYLRADGKWDTVSTAPPRARESAALMREPGLAEQVQADRAWPGLRTGSIGVIKLSGQARGTRYQIERVRYDVQTGEIVADVSRVNRETGELGARDTVWVSDIVSFSTDIVGGKEGPPIEVPQDTTTGVPVGPTNEAAGYADMPFREFVEMLKGQDRIIGQEYSDMGPLANKTGEEFTQSAAAHDIYDAAVIRLSAEGRSSYETLDGFVKGLRLEGAEAPATNLLYDSIQNVNERRGFDSEGPVRIDGKQAREEYAADILNEWRSELDARGIEEPPLPQAPDAPLQTQMGIDASRIHVEELQPGITKETINYTDELDGTTRTQVAYVLRDDSGVVQAFAVKSTSPMPEGMELTGLSSEGADVLVNSRRGADPARTEALWAEAATGEGLDVMDIINSEMTFTTKGAALLHKTIRAQVQHERGIQSRAQEHVANPERRELFSDEMVNNMLDQATYFREIPPDEGGYQSLDVFEVATPEGLVGNVAWENYPEGTRTFVIVDRATGEVTGMSIAVPDAGLTTVVRPNFRRRGVATELYRQMEEAGVPIKDLSGRGLQSPAGAKLSESILDGAKDARPEDSFTPASQDADMGVPHDPSPKTPLTGSKREPFWIEMTWDEIEHYADRSPGGLWDPNTVMHDGKAPIELIEAAEAARAEYDAVAKEYWTVAGDQTAPEPQQYGGSLKFRPPDTAGMPPELEAKFQAAYAKLGEAEAAVKAAETEPGIGHMTAEQARALKEHIRQNGINFAKDSDPFVLAINPNTGDAVMFEGFHRDNRARELMSEGEHVDNPEVLVIWDDSVVSDVKYELGRGRESDVNTVPQLELDNTFLTEHQQALEMNDTIDFLDQEMVDLSAKIPEHIVKRQVAQQTFHWPAPKKSHAIIKRPTTNFEKLVNQMYHLGDSTGLSFWKAYLPQSLIDSVNGETVFYNLTRRPESMPHGAFEHNLELLDATLLRMHVKEEVRIDMAERMRALTEPGRNDQDFFNFMEHLGLVFDHALIDAGAPLDLRLDVARVFGRDVEARPTHYLPEDGIVGNREVTQAVPPVGRTGPAGEVIARPSRMIDLAGHARLPDLGLIADGIGFMAKNARRMNWSKNAWDATRAAMHVATQVKKPTILVFRIAAVAQRVGLEQAFRAKMALGARGTVMTPGGVPLPYAALNRLLGKVGVIFPKEDPRFRGVDKPTPEEIGTLYEDTVALEYNLPSRHVTQPKSTAIYTNGEQQPGMPIFNAWANQIIYHHMSAEGRLLAAKGPEGLIEALGGGDRAAAEAAGILSHEEIGVFYDGLLEVLMNSDGYLGMPVDQVIRKWAYREYESTHYEAGGGHPELMNGILTGRVQGDIGINMGEAQAAHSNAPAYEKYETLNQEAEAIRGQLAEMRATRNRGTLDVEWMQALQARYKEIRQEQYLLRKRHQLKRTTKQFNASFKITNKEKLAAYLKQEWENGTIEMPHTLNVEAQSAVRYRSYAEKWESDVSRAWSETWYKFYKPLGWADLHFTRGGLYYQLVERNLTTLLKRGVPRSLALKIAQAKGAKDTRDWMFDLSARNSFERATRDIWYFGAAQRELAVTWFKKIPAQYGTVPLTPRFEGFFGIEGFKGQVRVPVGHAILIMQGMALVRALANSGLYEYNEKGDLVTNLPGWVGVDNLINAIPGFKVGDIIFGKASGANMITSGGLLPNFSLPISTVLQYAGNNDVKWGPISFKELGRELERAGLIWGQDATLWPAQIVYAAQIITGEPVEYDPISPTYQKYVSNRMYDVAIQNAYVELGKQGIFPPRPEDFGLVPAPEGLESVDPKFLQPAGAVDAYKKARQDYFHQLFEVEAKAQFRGSSAVGALGSVFSPFMLYSTSTERQEWDTFFTELLDDGVPGLDEQDKTMVFNYLKDHPLSVAYSIFTSRYTTQEGNSIFTTTPDRAEADWWDDYLTHQKEIMPPREYALYTMAMSSYRIYTNAYTEKLHDISPDNQASEILRDGSARKDALLELHRNQDNWDNYNPEAANIVEKAKIGWEDETDKPTQTLEAEWITNALEGLNQLAPYLSAETGTLPGDVKSVKGLLGAMMSDAKIYGKPTTQLQKDTAWYFNEVIDPYEKETSALYDRAREYASYGYTDEASLVYAQIRDINNAQREKERGGYLYPTPEEMFWGNKNEYDKQLWAINSATKPVVWLTEFQLDKVGYPSFEGREEMIKELTDHDNEFHRLYADATGDYAQELQAWHLDTQEFIASKYGPEAQELVKLANSSPIGRIDLTGIGEDSADWDKAVELGNQAYDAIKNAGYNPAYNSKYAVEVKAWLSEKLIGMGALDPESDLGGIMEDLSAALPQTNGDPRKGMLLWDAIFFGNHDPKNVDPSLIVGLEEDPFIAGLNEGETP